MKKYFYLIILLVALTIAAIYDLPLLNSCPALSQDKEIIGTVNSENIYLKDFNRLYNAKKKKQEKITKEKLLNSIIDEYLVLQEAEKRNIKISDEAIFARLNQIKKNLGEEGFRKFLLENNATLQDAKSEIKNQLLYSIVKKQIPDLNAFILQKRLNSRIIIYKDEIPQKISIPNIEELIKIEKKRNYIYSELAKNINVYNKSSSSNLPGSKTLQEKSSEIKELIKKIEQRKITIKTNE